MVTNLPAEAKALWIKVMEAKTPEEKLRALQEFLSKVPKHKGTERLRAFVRKRIAELRREIEFRERMRRAAAAKRAKLYVEKEGDVQLVLLGLPNSGRSSLLRLLTNAKVEVSEVPVTTTEPVPGMFIYKNLYIQLVEAPPIIPGSEDSILTTVALGLARNADGLLLVIDLTRDPVEQFQYLRRCLEERHILLERPTALVIIEKRASGGVQVVGNLRDCTVEDVRRLLAEYRIYHALVKIYGEATLDDVEMALFEETVYKPTIVVGTKLDVAPPENVKRLQEVVGEKFPLLLISCRDPRTFDPEYFTNTVLRTLNLIKIYTKSPYSEVPSEKPLLVPEGTTVIEVAKRIHSKLYENFKYAKVIRYDERGRRQVLRVGRDFVLRDGDIVEIHT